MPEFVDIVLSFPTVLFSFLLLVVVGYWVFVLVGGSDLTDGDGAGDGSDEAGGVAGVLGSAGLGGVPSLVVISLLVAVAWFICLVGSVIVRRTGSGALVPVASVAVLVLAIVLAWLAIRLFVRPLRRFFPEGEGPSRSDFVGKVCVVRTGRVGRDFGQAEVTAADGSSAVVQVRQTGGDTFRAGTPALIYDYDADGEFFWIIPVDAALGTERES